MRFDCPLPNAEHVGDVLIRLRRNRSEDVTDVSRFVFSMDRTGRVESGGRRFLRYVVRLLRTTFGQWLEDKTPQLAAALAYYAVFSLAPMMLVVLAFFGLIYGNSEVARREILHQVYSVLFANAIDVINTLSAAQSQGMLKSQLKRYLSPALLILDEVGYLPVDQRGADLLFQVISQRYERGSIVITSNKAFKQWPAIFKPVNLPDFFPGD